MHPSSRLVALVGMLLAAVLAGCGTSPVQRRFGDLTVHTFTRGASHAYVLAQAGSLVMIDSGYERNAAALDAALRDEGLDPTHLRAVVLTHGHADHAGGARYFQQRYGARVVAGSGVRAMLASGRNEPLCSTGFLARTRRTSDQAAIYTPTPVDVAVDDGLALAPLTGVDAAVTTTPGHTAGSLVVTAGAAAFVGGPPGTVSTSCHSGGAEIRDGENAHFQALDGERIPVSPKC